MGCGRVGRERVWACDVRNKRVASTIRRGVLVHPSVRGANTWCPNERDGSLSFLMSQVLATSMRIDRALVETGGVSEGATHLDV